MPDETSDNSSPWGFKACTFPFEQCRLMSRIAKDLVYCPDSNGLRFPCEPPAIVVSQPPGTSVLYPFSGRHIDKLLHVREYIHHGRIPHLQRPSLMPTSSPSADLPSHHQTLAPLALTPTQPLLATSLPPPTATDLQPTPASPNTSQPKEDNWFAPSNELYAVPLFPESAPGD